LAFSAFSIHHFNDRQIALSEIRRILKKGGTFYVWDRVPGRIVRYGTKVEELSKLSDGFEKFELLGIRGTVKARFTK
jgi:ubiquinone/menaquinone biosynthesis C-methylase UbiE